MSVQEGIVEIKYLSTTVTRVVYEAIGTRYDVIFTWLPDGFASAKWIVNIYGFGALWLGNVVSLEAGYLREKMPLLNHADAKEMVRLIRHVLQ
ncbi:hypothetical protein LCGC14_0444010 [marine sediment metagenome]|uniref:Uncharacterized protein n=1 Tax=marine sediment metagenome TaxID=412755 RepID=A0A0F9T2P5_9ZZZZ